MPRAGKAPESPRADSRSGLGSLTQPVIAPPAILPVCFPLTDPPPKSTIEPQKYAIGGDV